MRLHEWFAIKVPAETAGPADVCVMSVQAFSRQSKTPSEKRIGFNLMFALHSHPKLSEINPYLNIISKHLLWVLTVGHRLGIDPQIHRPQPPIMRAKWPSSIFTGNGEKQMETRDARTPAPSWCTFCPPAYRRRLFSSFIFVWNPWIFFGQMRFMTLAFCISKLSHRILTVGGGATQTESALSRRFSNYTLETNQPEHCFLISRTKQ